MELADLRATVKRTPAGRFAGKVRHRAHAQAGEAREAIARMRFRPVPRSWQRPMLSQPCTMASLESPEFLQWADRLRPEWDAQGTCADRRVLVHRKLWEWCYIAEALSRGGMLKPGVRGIGFGVGKEPLVALFASLGARITATDLDEHLATAAGWRNNDEFAGRLEALNERGICPPGVLARNAVFRSADMRDLPPDLGRFDFSWSSCAFEHLGSIDAGLEFVLAQMECLRPGGLSVHTTEFNVASDDETVTEGPTVLYRRRDIERLARALRARGHEVRCDFTLGDTPADQYVDKPPYGQDDMHLKVEMDQFVTTSYGIAIRKRGRFLRLRAST